LGGAVAPKEKNYTCDCVTALPCCFSDNVLTTVVNQHQDLLWVYQNRNTEKNGSVKIPTKCSFVIEFIIPKFIEGSTCFKRHTAHHQEL
jgi:hypothetical protein